MEALFEAPISLCAMTYVLNGINTNNMAASMTHVELSRAMQNIATYCSLSLLPCQGDNSGSISKIIFQQQHEAYLKIEVPATIDAAQGKYVQQYSIDNA